MGGFNGHFIRRFGLRPNDSGVRDAQAISDFLFTTALIAILRSPSIKGWWCFVIGGRDLFPPMPTPLGCHVSFFWGLPPLQ